MGKTAHCCTGHSCTCLSKARTYTRTHKEASAGMTHNFPSCSSGRPRCLPHQDRGAWQMPCHLPGTEFPVLSAIGLAGQVSMAAGGQACSRGQWLALAELSGCLEGADFLPRHRAFCCPDVQLAWAALATPRAHHILPALGTGRLSQLTSRHCPSPGHMPLLDSSHFARKVWHELFSSAPW